MATPPEDFVAQAQESARRLVEHPGAWPDMRAGVKKLFDDLAPTWDQIATSAGHLTALEAALDRVSGCTRAADLGTGTGRGAELIKRRFPDTPVAAIDLSEPMLRQAVPSGARYVVGDGAALPLTSGALDLAVALNMFVFVSELQRVVRPGGRLVIVYTGGERTPVYVPTDVLLEHLDDFDAEPGRAGDGIFIVATRSTT